MWRIILGCVRQGNEGYVIFRKKSVRKEGNGNYLTNILKSYAVFFSSVAGFLGSIAG